VFYKIQENDPVSGIGSSLQEESTSDEGTFLTETTNELEKRFVLVDEKDARRTAGRLRFLHEIGRSQIKIDTKLQGSRLQVNDIVEIKTPKIFERIGSNFRRKVGTIESIKKDSSKATMSVEDLGNAFSRVATFTVSTAVDFDSSPDKEKSVQGYFTDTAGMQDNDRDTFGINLFW